MYNESNIKILDAGEVLTPGKIIMLKNYSRIYTEEFTNEATTKEKGGQGKGNLKKLTNFTFENLDGEEVTEDLPSTVILNQKRLE